MRLFTPPRDFIPPPGLIAGKLLSARQPPKEVPRGVLLRGRDFQRRIRWMGRFRCRADAEQFVRSSITGELWFDRSLWRLPSPEWHPDYGPLIYELAIALDGHNTGSFSSGSSYTIGALTTVNAGDVIVAFVQGGASISQASVTSLSTTGVTWQGAARKKVTPATNQTFELWYGTASATLSAVSTTVNFNVGLTTGRGLIFGVSGANTSSINDSNASLPATSNGTNSIPTTTAVSTSNANDMIISGVVFTNGTGPTETAGSGYTLIDTLAGVVADEYKVFSTTQSSISVPFGTTSGSLVNWNTITDAIQAAISNPFTQPLLFM